MYITLYFNYMEENFVMGYPVCVPILLKSKLENLPFYNFILGITIKLNLSV